VLLSERLEAEIQATGNYVDLWVYPGDDHNLSKWFTFAMECSLMFFDRYLKG
jgi:dipeptidyl aminopeptidase/acylaminoacyl peptidase